jgi:hypothetical protein
MRLILAASLLLIATLPAAAGDALLARLAGDWIGRGTMKLRPDAAPERVYCKITNTLSADGMTLLQKGRCSLASNSGRVDGSLTVDAGGNVSGSLNSLASKGPASLSGRRSSSRLELTATFVDALTGEPSQSANVMETGADGYRLTTTRTDPKDGSAYTSSEIAFTAK